MEKLKIGVVGLGQRGFALLSPLLAIKDAVITAVCDTYEDRVQKAVDLITAKYDAPATFINFDEFLEKGDFTAVLICTCWEEHIKMAIKSMKAGKITAMEVGGAKNIEECWELVETYEQTKTPFFFLENCCYDRFELLSLNLARKGYLGEIVHCKGAYAHDLRDEILGGNVNRHYRLEEYTHRNCENYPTHELGPIAKILDINRGNRMVSLVSVASKGAGLSAFAKTDKNPDKTLADRVFKQGDVVNTVITCEGGETILLTLDTTLPRFYSRDFTVRGTKGMTSGEVNLVFLEEKLNPHEFYETEKTIEKYLNNANEFTEFLPPYWQNITDEERELGHGGMDLYMLREFVRIALGDKHFPLDVYDAAAWMCITALSEKSISEGNAVQLVPDFTKGEYKNRKRFDVIEL
ncbi:MAG: Gfo/Idh/MocA family oxidoreductase [Clostridia bacterium]|nr:Gfo/Idh/MocA family oxidoreductase [Clostridia bacterium]